MSKKLIVNMFLFFQVLFLQSITLASESSFEEVPEIVEIESYDAPKTVQKHPKSSWGPSFEYTFGIIAYGLVITGVIFWYKAFVTPRDKWIAWRLYEHETRREKIAEDIAARVARIQNSRYNSTYR